MSSSVMTVLGPVAAEDLGRTLPHEHFLCDLSRLNHRWDSRLSEEPLAIVEAKRYREAGGRTVVDVTNLNFGRDPEALARISRETGLHVVMGCGWYREPYYEQSLYEKSTNQIAAEIVNDIKDGVEGTGIRPGIIGEIGCWRSYIAPAEERSFRAAARAHKETGLTITTHAAERTHAWNPNSPLGLQQLDLLEEEDVDPRRVIMGHCDTYPEPDYHEAVAHRGAWVQFDMIRGGHDWETTRRVHFIQELLRKGYINQLLLSQDVCIKPHLRAYGGGGYDYIMTEFIPLLLKAGITQEQIDIITIRNPAVALSGAAD